MGGQAGPRHLAVLDHARPVAVRRRLLPRARQLMETGLHAEIRRSHRELATLREELTQREEQLFALALREVNARRALLIARPALKHETERQPDLRRELLRAGAERRA